LRDTTEPATLAAAQSILLVLQQNYSGFLQISKLRVLQQILINTQNHAGNLKLTVTPDSSGELGDISSQLHFEGDIYTPIAESIRLCHY